MLAENLFRVNHRYGLLLLVLTGIGLNAQKPETRALDAYDKISVSDQIVAVIAPGSESKVDLDPSPNIWNEDIITKIEDKQLKIKTKFNHYYDKAAVFCYVFYTGEITNLAMTRGGIIRTDSNQILQTKKLEIDATIDGFANLTVDVDELSIKAGQGSDIFIRGKANKVTIDASAGAKVHLDDVECSEANVHTYLGAKVWLTPTQTYFAHAGTGGKIYYRKDPAGKFERTRVTGGNVELVPQ